MRQETHEEIAQALGLPDRVYSYPHILGGIRLMKDALEKIRLSCRFYTEPEQVICELEQRITAVWNLAGDVLYKIQTCQIPGEETIAPDPVPNLSRSESLRTNE